MYNFHPLRPALIGPALFILTTLNKAVPVVPSVAQLIENFSAFYRTWSFMAFFRTAHHLILMRVRFTPSTTIVKFPLWY